VLAKEGVIDRLNIILTNELTAINQYFIHAEMCANWGFPRLHHKLRDLSIEEMRDAQELIEHILYLEGLPNLQRLGTVNVGEAVREDLELDAEQERAAIAALTEAIAHCAQVQDFTTRAKLEAMVKGEEEQLDWLETQLESIRQTGIEIYLGHQLVE
jgi:bacterioferritin